MSVERAEGDDVRVRDGDGVLHIWDRGYNTSGLTGTHAGSWPLASIRRWRQVPR